MNILHNNNSLKHFGNSKLESKYRIINFEENVEDSEILNLLDLTLEKIIFTHSLKYFKKIKRSCELKSSLAEVKLNIESFKSILYSAVLSIIAAQRNGFAITRPPGHHASKERASGFCFFNNIAIATNYLLEFDNKVCIIDIDGHHGNGTQSIFSKNKNVLFCSIHRDNIYPKNTSRIDLGKGINFKKTINIPLLEGSGDDLFLKSLEFLRKYIEIFNPDYIGISAGFDGYFKDKILDLNYSKYGYYKAGELIKSFSKPTFSVLEGGYHEEIKECVNFFISGISGIKIKGSLNISSANLIEQNDNTLKFLSKVLSLI